MRRLALILLLLCTTTALTCTTICTQDKTYCFTTCY